MGVNESATADTPMTGARGTFNRATSTYTVAHGDDPISIAGRFQLVVGQLAAANYPRVTNIYTQLPAVRELVIPSVRYQPFPLPFTMPQYTRVPWNEAPSEFISSPAVTSPALPELQPVRVTNGPSVTIAVPESNFANGWTASDRPNTTSTTDTTNNANMTALPPPSPGSTAPVVSDPTVECVPYVPPTQVPPTPPSDPVVTPPPPPPPTLVSYPLDAYAATNGAAGNAVRDLSAAHWAFYTVAPGDNVIGILKRFGLTGPGENPIEAGERLKALNPRFEREIEYNQLEVGTVLNIPVPRYAPLARGAYPLVDAVETVLDVFPPFSGASGRVKGDVSGASRGIYTVADGDQLSAIVQRFALASNGLSLGDAIRLIILLNPQLEESILLDRLPVGAELKIP